MKVGDETHDRFRKFGVGPAMKNTVFGTPAQWGGEHDEYSPCAEARKTIGYSAGDPEFVNRGRIIGRRFAAGP